MAFLCNWTNSDWSDFSYPWFCFPKQICYKTWEAEITHNDAASLACTKTTDQAESPVRGLSAPSEGLIVYLSQRIFLFLVAITSEPASLFPEFELFVFILLCSLWFELQNLPPLLCLFVCQGFWFKVLISFKLTHMIHTWTWRAVTHTQHAVTKTTWRLILFVNPDVIIEHLFDRCFDPNGRRGTYVKSRFVNLHTAIHNTSTSGKPHLRRGYINWGSGTAYLVSTCVKLWENTCAGQLLATDCTTSKA